MIDYGRSKRVHPKLKAMLTRALKVEGADRRVAGEALGGHMKIIHTILIVLTIVVRRHYR